MKFFWEMHKSEIFFGRRFLPSAIAVSRLRRLIPLKPPQTKNPRPISPPKQKILEPPLLRLCIHTYGHTYTHTYMYTYILISIYIHSLHTYIHTNRQIDG